MQLRTRLPKGITLALAGRTVVQRDRMRQALGYTAFTVWERLSLLRAPDGTCHPTRVGVGKLVGFARVHPESVKQALERLRACGLVEPVGWSPRLVMKRGKRIQRKVYLRKVYGAILRDGYVVTGECLVPQKCADWLVKANMHGGERVGAGRKQRSAQTSDLVGKPGKTHKLKPGNQVPPTSNQVPPTSGGQLGNQVPPPIIHIQVSRKNPGSSLLTEESRAPRSGGTLPSFSQTELASGGTLLGVTGPTRSRHPLALVASFPAPCPPRPDLAPAAVPPPPLLPEDVVDAEELCHALARAFRGAAESRTKQRCWLFLSGVPRNWKHFKLMTEAAKLMRELEIAPAAWCAWCWDVWLDMGKDEQRAEAGPPKPARRGSRRRFGKRSPSGPPVAWVFGAKRLRERWGWFRKEERQYEGGRTILGPLQRELSAKYEDMRRAVVRGGLTLEQAAQQFFPGDTYERELGAAKNEIAENRERLVRQASHGDFLW